MYYYYYPILLDLGFIKIYTWGLIVAIGVYLAYYLLKKYGCDEHCERLFFLSLVLGFLGSRILYITGHSDEFNSIFDLIAIWNGGLDWGGGFFLAFLGFYIYTKYYKLNFLKYADKFTLPLVLGFMISRIGCVFGDGGHLGKETQFVLGAVVEGVKRHYTAVYSVFGLGLLFLGLYYLSKKNSFDGYLFSMYLILYGVGRFFSDFLRADSTYFGFTFAQYLAIVSVCIGLFIIWKNHVRFIKLIGLLLSVHK